MATNIYFNTAAQDPQNAVCLNEVNTGPSSILTMVLGSKIPVNLYFVDGEGAFDPMSGDATYSVKVGIGKLGQSSTGGTYTLSYGGNTTSALAYNASAATVSTALNLLASIVSAGGVTVSGTWPVLVVTFNSVGVRTAITGTQDALTPTSALIIDEFQVGDVSTVSKWGIENAISPPVYQTTWTPITNGWTAVLDLSTFELAASLAGVDATGMYFEARITDPSGNPLVRAQPLMLVRNRVINPGSLVPADRDSYLTAAEVRDGFVQNRFLVDGLTGGTSADLDGIPTAGAVATVGWMAAVVVANQLSFYRLESSTQAESSPTWIRPDDYNGTTNQRVWHLLAEPSVSSDLTEYQDFGSYSAPDTLLVERTANIVISAFNVVLQPGADPVEIHLDTANALPGNIVIFRIVLGNVTASVELHNDGTIPAEMLNMSADPSGLSTAVSGVAVWDGDNWQLTSSTRSLGYAVDYLRQGTLAAANLMLATNSEFAAKTINITGASNSSSPNDTVNVSSLTSAEATGNADFAIVPKANGALLAQVPDGTAAGGNKRGACAIDLQLSRNFAEEIASDYYSVIVGGSRNKIVAGFGGAIVGGRANQVYGDFSSAGGDGSTTGAESAFAFGFESRGNGVGSAAFNNSISAGSYASSFGSATASGNWSFATGKSLASKIGQVSASSYKRSVVGDAQRSDFTLGYITSDATPAELFTDAASERLTLGNSGTWTFEILVTAFCVASGESDGWRFFGVIHRGANAAATAIVGTVVKEHVGATVWDFDVDADTTNGSLRLMATGEAGKTVLWNSAVRTSEIN